MIATSTVVIFLLIYLNTYALEHVLFSETRLSMAILMRAAMAVVMLGFMFAMYPSKRANAGIFAGGAAGRGDLYEIEASELDRKSAVSGKSVSVRVELGGRGLIKNKIYDNTSTSTEHRTKKKQTK